MNCLMVIKNMETKEAMGIMLGSITLSEDVVEFSATPHSMNKRKDFCLTEAKLKKIGDINIILSGRMDDYVAEWHIIPR